MKQKTYILYLLLAFGISVLQAQDNVTIKDVVTGKAEVTATNSIRLLPGFHAVAGSNFHAYIDAGAEDETPVLAPTTIPGGTTQAVVSSGKNYIRSITFREAQGTMPDGTFKHLEQIQYFDGLGRPDQVVQVGASPLGNNIVQPIVYDDFGREAKTYLPFVAPISDIYVGDAEQKCFDYYNQTVVGKETDARPFSFTDFENSPLNRVESQMGVGQDWFDEDAKVSFEYLTNPEAISSWDEDDGVIYFLANSLYITQTTDENGHVSREYKDKLGQVVLKESINGIDTLQTHYVYDDFGLLRTVVPPLAASPADTELCYSYTYDGRKRMISKKIPGAAIVYMVYDQRDRLVLSQDGNMRTIADNGAIVANTNKYLFTKYDHFNRPVMTGVLTATRDLAGLRTDFEEHGDVSSEKMFESYDRTSNPNTYGYTLGDSYPSSCPVVKDKVLTVTWYDDYDFAELSGLGELDFYDHVSPGTTYANLSSKTKGVATGTLVKALEVESSGLSILNSELVSVSYYDDYGNLIKAVSKNHQNGYDVVHSKYEPITYQVLETIQEHKDSSLNVELAITKNFDYDHTGRLLETTCKVNNEDKIVLNASRYNELGELVSKYLHSDDVSAGTNKAFVQKVDYSYNIRGWLTSINNPDLRASDDGDLFGMRLYYNDITGLNSTAVPATSTQYNGNITAMVSGIKFDDSPIRGYGFDYDDINRLKTARYGEGTALSSAHGKFNVTGDDNGIRYDKNGNIKHLQRNYNGTLADNLTYNYENNNKSNRLQKVTDPSGDMADMADYVARTGGDYTYDANGNMIYDPAKQGTVTYNYLNLPARVDLGTKGKIYYHYDAAGNKLAKYIENTTSSENTTTEYISNLVYTNTKLSFLSTEEGRAIPIEKDGNIRWHYEYNLKDHLGNTRVTFGGSNLGGAADIVQTSSYYPFGMVMAQKNYNSGGNSYQLNKYLYNGKELQSNEFEGASLDWYDYGRRFYAPDLGRFTTQDPLAEDYFDLSPYGYCAGNPIACRDENGEWINFVIGAAVGAATDYALQVAVNVVENGGEFSMDAFTNVDGASIAVSAGAGALGVGIATKVNKAMKVANMAKGMKAAVTVGSEVATDAAVSATNQMVTTGTVDLKDVAIDATAGQIVGKTVSSAVKNKAQASKTAKVLHNQADRAQRVANGSREVRQVAADKATQKAESYGAGRATAAGVASSGTASTVVKELDKDNQ